MATKLVGYLASANFPTRESRQSQCLLVGPFARF